MIGLRVKYARMEEALRGKMQTAYLRGREVSTLNTNKAGFTVIRRICLSKGINLGRLNGRCCLLPGWPESEAVSKVEKEGESLQLKS